MKVRPGWIQQRYPEALEQCWAPPNATPQFKALKGCRSPTVLQFSPHPKSCTPCSSVLSLQHRLLCDSRSLSSLPSTSTATCCSYGAQMLSTISAPPAHFTSSHRSAPAKALYLLSFAHCFCPSSLLRCLLWTIAFLHNKVAIRIFETMEPVINGSPDNSREIRFHALRFSVTPCMLHTQRSNCTRYALLCPGLELAKLFSCICTVAFSLAATATSAKKSTWLMWNTGGSFSVSSSYEA